MIFRRVVTGTRINSALTASKDLHLYQLAELIVRGLRRTRDVIHSDGFLENLLTYQTTPGSLDLLLNDFGRAVYRELGLNRNQLPSDPFYLS